ncbi:MAG: hypothetical protein JNM00_05425 [Flavobacteriales bacterium]|nr:hypothetical protein [Flavobacteriales bacterium]
MKTLIAITLLLIHTSSHSASWIDVANHTPDSLYFVAAYYTTDRGLVTECVGILPPMSVTNLFTQYDYTEMFWTAETTDPFEGRDYFDPTHQKILPCKYREGNPIEVRTYQHQKSEAFYRSFIKETITSDMYTIYIIEVSRVDFSFDKGTFTVFYSECDRLNNGLIVNGQLESGTYSFHNDSLKVTGKWKNGIPQDVTYTILTSDKEHLGHKVEIKVKEDGSFVQEQLFNVAPDATSSKLVTPVLNGKRHGWVQFSYHLPSGGPIGRKGKVFFEDGNRIGGSNHPH